MRCFWHKIYGNYLNFICSRGRDVIKLFYSPPMAGQNKLECCSLASLILGCKPTQMKHIGVHHLKCGIFTLPTSIRLPCKREARDKRSSLLPTPSAMVKKVLWDFCQLKYGFYMRQFAWLSFELETNNNGLVL
jgi:hypothetical protein